MYAHWFLTPFLHGFSNYRVFQSLILCVIEWPRCIYVVLSLLCAIGSLYKWRALQRDVFYWNTMTEIWETNWNLCCSVCHSEDLMKLCYVRQLCVCRRELELPFCWTVWRCTMLSVLYCPAPWHGVYNRKHKQTVHWVSAEIERLVRWRLSERYFCHCVIPCWELIKLIHRWRIVRVCLRRKFSYFMTW